MASTVLRYLGLGIEGAYGTPAAEADFHLDIASASLDSPSEPVITYEGGIGRMPARIVPGAYVPGGGAEFGVTMETFAYLLYLLFGVNATDDNAVADVVDEAFATITAQTTKTVTLAHQKVVQGSVEVSAVGLVAHDDEHGNIVSDNASTVVGRVDYGAGVLYLSGLTASTNYTVDYSWGWYAHTLTPSEGNELPSFTAFVGKDVMEHQFNGCVVNQLDLSVEQELLNAKLDIACQKDLKGTLLDLEDLKLDLSQYGERVKAFHDCQLKVADAGAVLGDISADVRSFKLSYNNNATTEDNMGLNSRYPQDGTGGPLEITGSMTIQLDDTSWKEDFWGGVTPDDDNPVLKQMELTIDAGNWGKAVIKLGTVFLQSVAIQPKGRDKMMQEISFKALYDVTTATIITAVVQNLNRWHDPGA